MPWKYVITRPAEKDLDRMGTTDREAVRRALNRMIEDPHSVDMSKLSGHEDEWRLRVGRWRARLLFDNSSGTMQVMRVLPRKEAYRG